MCPVVMNGGMEVPLYTRKDILEWEERNKTSRLKDIDQYDKFLSDVEEEEE